MATGTLAVRALLILYRWSTRLRYRSDLLEGYGAEMEDAARMLLEEGLQRGGGRGLLGAFWTLVRDLGRPVPAVPRGDPTRDFAEASAADRGMLRGAADDLVYAVRSLRREPRFVSLLVGVLTFGMVANVSVFSVVDAYLLEPLPYPESDRLYNVEAWGALSWTEVDDVFELAVSWDLDVFSLVGDAGPQVVRGAWVTPDFLPAYGIQPALGRAFRPDEGHAAESAVAIISHSLWLSRFGGDRDVLGRTFAAYTSDRPDDAETFTVVGVLPEDFWHVNAYTDVLVPLREERAVYMGRLHPGVSVEGGEAALAAIAEGRVTNAPEGFRIRLHSLREQYVEAVRPTLAVVQTAALLVLLIACVNGAVLLLLRASRRSREVAVRRAVGAGRVRLARQLVFEGLLVAGGAGVLGAVLSVMVLDASRGVVATRLGRTAPGGLQGVGVDAQVLLVTCGVVLLLGLVFGLIPALVTLRDRDSGALKGGTRAGAGLRSRARSVMVAAEVALSLSLLIGAGLMVRSAYNLQARDVGFRATGAIGGEVGLRAASYPTGRDQDAFFSRLLDDVRALSTVEAAGLLSAGPFVDRPASNRIEGEESRGGGDAVVNVVAPGSLEALEVPLRRGRFFGAQDVEGAERVAVVTETLADQLWPGQNPLGRGVRVQPEQAGPDIEEPEPFLRIVGVVGDVDYNATPGTTASLFLPLAQSPRLWLTLIVRTDGRELRIVPEIESVLQGIDPEVPLSAVESIDSAVAAARAPTGFLAWLFAAFASFALVLAVVGLYGVVSYAAEQRRREVAIRVALGADRGRIARTFLLSGLGVALGGVVVGLGGGRLVGRLLESQLYEVGSSDAWTLGSLGVAMLATAAIAVWIPARRAARSSPMGVLREE